jgi:hypothetical protein
VTLCDHHLGETSAQPVNERTNCNGPP